MNSMSFESVSAGSPAIDEGSMVRPVYTYAIPVAAIQKAIAQANSIDYLPIHFYFSFGIGASVNDNTCYADGIVYLKLDSTTKKLSILGGNISGTIEDKNYTLQQSFSYKITTKTDTSEYEDIPTQPQYIFKKSYGTKCWFDLKLPAVIDTTETNSDYPSSPVGKTIQIYTNVTGSIGATILNISIDFTTLNCVVDFSNQDKDVLEIKAVPYLVSNEIDDTAPIVLQTNVNKSTGILYKSDNTIQAIEFIETTDNNILQQTGNRIWAKEFIEDINSAIKFNKNYTINCKEIKEV